MVGRCPGLLACPGKVGERMPVVDACMCRPRELCGAWHTWLRMLYAAMGVVSRAVEHCRASWQDKGLGSCELTLDYCSNWS